MKKKNSLILDDEFIQYCELNKIDNIEKLAKETFNRGFSILKYGETPKVAKGKEKVIEKEIIKEVIVEKQLPPEIKYIEKEVIKEVPVEKVIEVIKEIPVEKIVEVIKEVPVEIKGDTKVITKEVIKEVPIEKVVEVEKRVEIVKEIKDTKEIERLSEENLKLKNELNKITTSLNNLNKGRFLKNSDLSSLYDE